ncbi:hypothetical protein M5K25_024415 [Dendrobium thyrsiflorum]|uniref:Uncharacterized protein n=1 Tax=Dendrobium thyrsiflorum TaxID=117978 RepID=A0ABD0U1Y6_DENTH
MNFGIIDFGIRRDSWKAAVEFRPKQEVDVEIYLRDQEEWEAESLRRGRRVFFAAFRLRPRDKPWALYKLWDNFFGPLLGALLDLLKKNSFDPRFVLYGCVEGFADGAASDPIIFGRVGSGLLHPFRLQTRAMGNMPPNADFAEVDSESPPRFTCSICDAMSWSDSSPSGKYKSSSELQSIGNTIMQASGASFLTYFSLTGVLGTAEITRHTSVGRGFASPSSVSPILSSDIKSASLMGCLTLGLLLEEFWFSRFRGASLAKVLLRSRCLYIGQSFQVKHWLGRGTFYHQFPYSVLGVLHRPENFVLRNFSVFDSHLSPHLSSDIGECDIFIIRMILFDFICFLFSLRTITSVGDGASLVLVLFSKLGRLGQTKIQGWLLLALGQAHWKDGLKTVAEPEVQHFFFSSASWLASLQMRKSQYCYSRMQVTRLAG